MLEYTMKVDYCRPKAAASEPGCKPAEAKKTLSTKS